MPEGRSNFTRWIEEIPRLIDESSSRFSSRDFNGTLRLLDRAEAHIINARAGMQQLERSGMVTPNEAKKVYYGLEVSRARMDTSRAMAFGYLGRTREAKRILGDVYARTGLPDQFAFGAMINLAGIHHLEGEKKPAWEAFRQAEELAHKMGPDQSVSSHLELIRGRLTRTFGRPHKKPGGRGRHRK